MPLRMRERSIATARANWVQVSLVNYAGCTMWTVFRIRSSILYEASKGQFIWAYSLIMLVAFVLIRLGISAVSAESVGMWTLTVTAGVVLLLLTGYLVPIVACHVYLLHQRNRGRTCILLHRCWKCHYSLKGIDAPHCPECGAARIVEL